MARVDIIDRAAEVTAAAVGEFGVAAGGGLVAAGYREALSRFLSPVEVEGLLTRLADAMMLRGGSLGASPDLAAPGAAHRAAAERLTAEAAAQFGFRVAAVLVMDGMRCGLLGNAALPASGGTVPGAMAAAR